MNLKEVPFTKSLAFQMVIWLGFMSTVPLGIAVYLNFTYAVKVLDDATKKNLYFCAKHQSKALQDCILSFQTHSRLLSENPVVVGGLKVLERIGVPPIAAETKERVAAKINKQYLPILSTTRKKLGLENVFLISSNGKIVYDSRTKKIDFLSAKDYLLAPVVESTLMLLSPQISDFSLDPTTKRPVLFFTAPVFYKKKLLGILAMQINPDFIYKIINNYTGLGKTGETVISQYKNNMAILLNPTRNAADFAFREDIFIKDPSSAMAKALSGQMGFGRAIDYRGKQILAAWEYIPYLRWGLVVKKDIQEVQEPIRKLKHISISVVTITLIFALFIAITTSRRIIVGVLNLMKVAKSIAQGDLSFQKEPIKEQDEIGTLALSVYAMADNLKIIVNNVKESSHGIINMYRDTLLFAQEEVQEDAQRYSHLEKIDTVSQKITHLSRDIGQQMGNIGQNIKSIDLQANLSQSRLSVMESGAQEILKTKMWMEDHFVQITPPAKTLKDSLLANRNMADRIHLLALNTAIEASQISTCDLGFKMVSKELLQLSTNIQKTCQDIEETTQQMDHQIQSGLLLMQKFSESIMEIFKEVESAHIFLNKLFEDTSQAAQPLRDVFQKIEEQIALVGQMQNDVSLIRQSMVDKKTNAKYSNNKFKFLEETSSIFQKRIDQLKT